MSIIKQVENARAGKEPALVCRVPSGWVVLCNMQHLRGYCILMPDPIVSSINDLTRDQRAAYLCDMVTVGDALIEVTGAYRINYAIMGNSDPVLHAHVVPRYLDEPEEFRKGGSWSYPQEMIDATTFDPERDAELMKAIAHSIKIRFEVASLQNSK
jgi:diadenosine tetraphosphate (Ap4A) HIT family hydrolase